jgi:hypothetical protein
VPTEPALTSPLARPAAIDAPGRSCWNGNAAARGRPGAAYNSCFPRAAARVKTRATCGESPVMLSGARSWRALRAGVCEAGRVPTGGSTGWPRICSIGVATAIRPPYSPTLSEIAAATRPSQ